MSRRIILVCEDDDLIKQLATFAIEAQGYEFETAVNADEALNKLKELKPDLILLDLNISGKGGEYVVQQLRKDPEKANIPIVLCSGEQDLPETAKRLKVQGYIRKPFEISEFNEVINRYLN